MQIVQEVSPFGRVVVTGSGLVTLLNSVRTSHVNGFALWDAVAFLSVGREPSRVAAQSIAKALLPPYSSDWPPAAKHAMTPTILMDTLALTAQDNLTSLRPALLAYFLGCMGDARTGPSDKVISAAVGAARGKLLAESTRDTLSALTALNLAQRRVLRDVATGGYTVAELEEIWSGQGKVHFKNANVGVLPEKLAALITCLREEGSGDDVVRLQPPYAALLGSWVRSNGELAVAMHGDKIDLDLETRTNLVFIAELRFKVGHALRKEVGRAFIESLAHNCVGVREADGTMRPPHTAEEFDAIPALRGLWSMLTAGFHVASASTSRRVAPRMPSLSAALMRAANAAAAGGVARMSAAQFQETLGWELLLSFRHLQAHVWESPAQLVRNGLTAGVVADAVSAAAHMLAHPVHGCFMLNGSSLQPKPEVASMKV